MDSLDNSIWNNESGPLQELLNESALQTGKYDARGVHIPSLSIFIILLLGLPGNLLVIVVYIGKTTTSTRTYLLALAIADTAVSICGILLTRVIMDRTTLYAVLCSVEISLTFSIYLLAFVSIERLLAVWRPHTFKLSATRAKMALCVITVVAIVTGAVMTVARVRHHVSVSRLFPMIVTMSGVIVMAVCYALVAAKLLRIATAARQKVGVQSGGQTAAPGPLTVSQSNSGKNAGNVGSAPPVKKLSVNDANTYKGVSLLFIITVVCIACCMPQWLAFVGIQVSTGLRRIFLLNSAVNPFIYSVVSSMFRNDVKLFYRKTVTTLSGSVW